MYLALGIIFLIASLVVAAVVIFTAIRAMKNGREIISKKNAIFIVPAFLIIYFLYVIASSYNGDKLSFFYFFKLVNTVFETLKFKPENSVILPICNDMPIFYADFTIAYILGVSTVILGFASIFSRKINNYLSIKSLLRKNCDVVVGDSEDALQYVKNNKDCILLGTNISTQRYADLIKQGVRVMRAQLDAKSLSRKLKNGKCNIIVFRDGNYSYTKIIDTFTELNDYGVNSEIYLEANQQEMKILKEKFITKADNNSGLYITGFNKYELMARRFVADYPITKYIPRTFYNDNFTLKNDKEINVVFVGFGKVNYQLFRMCAMQFQFAKEKEDDGKLVSSPVNYYIYDNVNTRLNNEFISRILYEFDEEFSNCDFPKPEKICEIHTCSEDINSIEARKQFKSFVNKDSFTYFIVSLDNDLEDASYAQTVKRLFDNDDNYRIFVRAKNNNGEVLNEINDFITYFGEEKNLYTHENIVNDDLTELAQRINLLYCDIDSPPDWLKKMQDKSLSPKVQNKILNDNLQDPERKRYMLNNWAKLPYIEQASNLYHALNLPFKLNLLGFEMIKKQGDDDLGVDTADFDKRYVNSGRASSYGDYSYFFKNESSNVLAYIEHSRWNALYILSDYKQMKKEDMQVVEENKDGSTVKSLPHKNTMLKQHACITTYYGLDELVRYKYKVLYPNEDLNAKPYADNKELQKLSKIYAYDYMDLDRLYDEVTAMGYKLVSNGK